MKINEVFDMLAEAGEAPIFYMAYGMLTNPDYMGDSQRVGVAELRNFEFELRQHANVIPKAGSTVYGGLWIITRQQLSQLDRIEGYPTYYDRKTVPVYVDGEKYAAEVYTMTPESREVVDDTSPSMSYVKSIVTGYKAFGIPTGQLADALKKTKEETQYRMKAGMIPYYKFGHEVKFMFMVPSDPAFGGSSPQIAKGNIDEGEDSKVAAVREAEEELGLLRGNMVSSPVLSWIGNVIGQDEKYRMDVYAVQVKDPKSFNRPHFETGKVMWLTAAEFMQHGRDTQKKIVSLIARAL